MVDHKRGMLYVGVGNNYSSPDGVCKDPKEHNCTPPNPDDHIDSILGLDLRTGSLKWATPTLNADTWTIYQPGQAPDFDFGTDPNLYTTVIDGRPTDLLRRSRHSRRHRLLGLGLLHLQRRPGQNRPQQQALRLHPRRTLMRYAVLSRVRPAHRPDTPPATSTSPRRSC